MNQRIEELTQIAYSEATKSEDALKRIEITLLNIEISVAKIKDKDEARVLSVISEDIKKSIVKIKESAHNAGTCMAEIAKINMEG